MEAVLQPQLDVNATGPESAGRARAVKKDHEKTHCTDSWPGISLKPLARKGVLPGLPAGSGRPVRYKNTGLFRARFLV